MSVSRSLLSGKQTDVAFLEAGTVENVKQQTNWVRSAAIEGAAEATILTAYGLVAECFLESDTPWYGHPIVLTSGVALFNVGCLTLTARMADKVGGNFATLKGVYLPNFACAMVYSIADLATMQTIIHEFGHALADVGLYNSRPVIQLNGKYHPFSGGQTKANNKYLTDLGMQIGKRNSQIVVIASGAAFSTLWNGLCLMAAQGLPKNNTKLKMYLRVSAAVNTIATLYYALSAYDKNNHVGGHDFKALDKYGISPAMAAMVVLGAVVLTQALLSTCSMVRTCRKQSKQLVVSDGDAVAPAMVRPTASNATLFSGVVADITTTTRDTHLAVRIDAS